MENEKLQAAISALQDFVERQGWSFSPKRRIPNGQQFTVSDGTHKVPMTCFVNGNIQVQGPDSPLKTMLQEWVETWRNGPSLL